MYMKTIKVSRDVIEGSKLIWNPTDDGNKVAAIKYIRQEIGLGLKEAKELIESDFDPGVMSFLKIEIDEDSDDPQFWIDKLVKLSYDMHVCHENLARLGCKMRGT